MNQQKAVASVIVLVAIAAGTVLVAESVVLRDSEVQTPASTMSGDGHAPVQKAEIDISPGKMDSSGDQITMNINVVATIYDGNTTPELSDLRYDHVLLCLYSQTGTVLHKEDLGTISTAGSTNEFSERYDVPVTTNQIPRYMIVDHPDLRDGNSVSVDVLEWKPDREIYTQHSKSFGQLRTNFTYPRSEKVGECG